MIRKYRFQNENGIHRLERKIEDLNYFKDHRPPLLDTDNNLCKSFKPLVNSAILNTLKFCNEQSNKCTLSHKWVTFSSYANQIFETLKYKSSLLPAVCKACLAIKFGLLQVFNDTILNYCLIDNYNFEDCQEGPYLKAISSNTNKNKIIFPRNTVILPCGFLLFDLLMQNTSDLFVFSPNQSPSYNYILKKNDEILKIKYTLNNFTYEYFKNIYLAYSSQNDINISFIQKFLTYNVGIDELSLISVYEAEAILLGELIRPSINASAYIRNKNEQNNLVYNFVDKTLEYQNHPIIDNSDKMQISEILSSDFSTLLKNTTDLEQHFYSRYFKDILDNQGKRIISYCIPSKIYTTINNEKHTIREFPHNVEWHLHAGLVATENIYNEEMLIANAEIDFDSFKKLKISNKNVV